MKTLWYVAAQVQAVHVQAVDEEKRFWAKLVFTHRSFRRCCAE